MTGTLVSWPRGLPEDVDILVGEDVTADYLIGATQDEGWKKKIVCSRIMNLSQLFIIQRRDNLVTYCTNDRTGPDGGSFAFLTILWLSK